MKITQENLVRVLASASDQGMTVKELLFALNQKKKRKALVRKILKKMAGQKQCFKHNNRFILIEAIEVSKKSTTRRAIGKRPVDKQIPMGICLYKNKRKIIYSFENQTEYLLANQGSNAFLHGNSVIFTLKKDKGGAKVADISSIVDHRINQLNGKIVRTRNGQIFFSPKQSIFPSRFAILGNQVKNSLPQEDIWLEISPSSMLKKTPEGQIIRQQNDVEERALIRTILVENKIASSFSATVLKSCEPFSKTVRLGKNDPRIDLRDYSFVTIDGENAKDFDDAIYAQKRKNQYQIWVSIADVSEYVEKGSKLDVEAFTRGNSTYFPEIAYPMLPEVLSNGLCSLKEGVNRKTLTCEIGLNFEGKVLSFKIYPSINKISCRLTYRSVDQFFASGKIKQSRSFPKLGDSLNLYREISDVLEKKRRKRGSINFDLPETRFIFDKDSRIVDVDKTSQTQAMKLIEQFMLEANENVGKFCVKHKVPILWRNHPKPLLDKVKELKWLLSNHNVKTSSLASGKQYNSILKNLKKIPDKDYLEVAMLRSMSLAVYETEAKKHFGLAATHYCHFTSPIRRYADLQVHRAIKSFLNNRKRFSIPEYLAKTVSERERLSVSAERSAVKLKKFLLVLDHIGTIFEARVSGFMKHGMFVEIQHPYVEGYVSLGSIYDDRYEVDKQHLTMWGKKQKRRISIGMSLKVMLTGGDWKNKSPNFDWICWLQEVKRQH